MYKVFTVCFSVAISLICSQAVAQKYPSRAVRVFTLEAGGNADFHARALTQGLATAMGQPFVVENRGGAGATVAAEAIKSAPADGYTLGFFGASFWLGPLMQDSPYKMSEFAPVVMESSGPNVLVVHPSLPVKSVKELIELARSKPGQLSYGASAVGSAPFLAGALFKSMTGVDVVNIPYKGGAATLTDLAGGRLQFVFSVPVTLAPFLKSGKVRPIAVTSLTASELAPDLPTIAATVPGFYAVSTEGLFAKAGVSKEIINQLSQESSKYLNRPDVKKKFLDMGTEVKTGTPEEFAAYIRSEIAQLGPVIKAAGIKGD